MIQEGLVRAIVTKNDDPEKLGRIQIRYPWLGGKAGDQPTRWARIARETARKNSGNWSLPEVGDEVLVGFEFDERDRPIILGSLYSNDQAPPTVGRKGDLNESGANNLRFIKTKSGHLLVFDDEDGQRTLELRDCLGNRVSLESDAKKIAVQDTENNSMVLDQEDQSITLKDTHNNQIKLNKDGVKVQTSKGHQLSLEAEADTVTIKDPSGNEITMSGSGIQIKSASKVEIVGSSEVTVEGSSQVKLGKGASQALLKGTMFMQLFNTHTHTIGPATTMPPSTPITPDMISQKVMTE